MKSYLLLFLLILSNMAACSETETSLDPVSKNNLQQQKKVDFAEADSELNRIYQEILLMYKDDTEFLQKLKESQRLWVQLRDANLAMQFPGSEPLLDYGSVYRTCAVELKSSFTQQRINFLKQWLDGVREGEVCGGSMKRVSQK